MKFFRQLLILSTIFYASTAFSQINLKLDSIENFKYDTANAQYYIDSKTMIYYDSLNRNTYWVRYERDTANSLWFPEDSAGYTYGSGGNPESEIYGEWDGGSSSFPSEDRLDFYYNSNNQIAKLYGFEYNTVNSSWDSTYYATYEYNSSQKLETEDQYYWNTSTMMWTGDERKTYSYDSNDRLVEELNFNWNSVGSTWETQAYSKDELLYNSGTGFLDTNYYYQWNSMNSMFETTSRSVYTSDAQGNFIVIEDQNFNVGPGWPTTERAELNYDVNSPLINIALPIDYVVDFYEGQASQLNYRKGFEYDYSLNKLYLRDSTVYSYSPATPTGISDLGKNKIKLDLFPNPTKDVVNISFESTFNSSVELLLIDPTGKQILQRRINGSTQLSLHGLKSGIYFVNIIGENGLISKKLVIEK